MSFTGTIVIPCPAPIVIGILLDARSLAAWNPALGPLFPADSTAVVGKRYGTLVRGVLPVVVSFTRIEVDTVEYRMRGAGAEERGRWLVETAADGGSNVTHSFEHRGVLLTMMRASFGGVADRRLERLAVEAVPRSTA